MKDNYLATVKKALKLVESTLRDVDKTNTFFSIFRLYNKSKLSRFFGVSVEHLEKAVDRIAIEMSAPRTMDQITSLSAKRRTALQKFRIQIYKLTNVLNGLRSRKTVKDTGCNYNEKRTYVKGVESGLNIFFFFERVFAEDFFGNFFYKLTSLHCNKISFHIDKLIKKGSTIVPMHSETYSVKTTDVEGVGNLIKLLTDYELLQINFLQLDFTGLQFPVYVSFDQSSRGPFVRFDISYKDILEIFYKKGKFSKKKLETFVEFVTKIFSRTGATYCYAEFGDVLEMDNPVRLSGNISEENRKRVKRYEYNLNLINIFSNTFLKRIKRNPVDDGRFKPFYKFKRTDFELIAVAKPKYWGTVTYAYEVKK